MSQPSIKHESRPVIHPNYQNLLTVEKTLYSQ